MATGSGELTYSLKYRFALVKTVNAMSALGAKEVSVLSFNRVLEANW